MNTSERHRLECEARHVLSQPFASRQQYLDLVGKQRGQQAKAELETEVKRQHGLRKGKS